MQETEQKSSVELFGGEPKIKVTKYLSGYYKWVTSKHGVMTHSSFTEVENFMKRHNHKYFLSPEIIEDDDYKL